MSRRRERVHGEPEPSARNSGIGPRALKRDMIKPRPYTEPPTPRTSGGTSGTVLGPRTKRNAVQRSASREGRLGEAARPGDGETNVAWYTISPRSFCVRTRARGPALGLASDSNPHVSARPSNAERSRGVCVFARARAGGHARARAAPAHHQALPAGRVGRDGARWRRRPSPRRPRARKRPRPRPPRPYRRRAGPAGRRSPEEREVRRRGRGRRSEEPSVVPPRERSDRNEGRRRRRGALHGGGGTRRAKGARAGAEREGIARRRHVSRCARRRRCRRHRTVAFQPLITRFHPSQQGAQDVDRSNNGCSSNASASGCLFRRPSLLPASRRARPPPHGAAGRESLGPMPTRCLIAKETRDREERLAKNFAPCSPRASPPLARGGDERDSIDEIGDGRVAADAPPRPPRPRPRAGPAPPRRAR